MYTKWAWLIAAPVSLAGAVLAVTLMPQPLSYILAGLSVTQAAIGVPAALHLDRRKEWARRVLVVLGTTCFGGTYVALAHQLWGSLAMNLALAFTVGVLTHHQVKPLFRRGREHNARR